MKTSSHFLIKVAAAWLLTAMAVLAQPSAFTYQGSLSNAGSPANGDYDIQFDLKDAASGGNTVGTVNLDPVTVTAGVFSVELDYGFAPAFIGFDRWLEISVRPSGSVDPYTTLAPRQPINSAPYANFAGGVNASTIIGQVTSANLAANVPLEDAANTFLGDNIFSGANSFSNSGNAFHGDGANLTNLDASNLSAGTLADGRLSANVALKNAVNTFSTNQIFNGNVGIGNSTPDTELTITTDSGVNDSVDFALKLHNDDFGNTTTGMLFSVEGIADPGMNYAKAGIAFQRTNSFARGKLHFLQNNATNTNSVTLADALMTLDNGNVGIGNTAPGSKLTVAGTVESTTGGVKFPDGSVQTTAAIGSSTEILHIGIGSYVAADSNDQLHQNVFDGIWMSGGELYAAINLPAGARILSLTAHVRDDAASDLRFFIQTKNNGSGGGASLGTLAMDTSAITGYGSVTKTTSTTISPATQYHLRILSINGAWPNNNTLAVQNFVIEWDRP